MPASVEGAWAPGPASPRLAQGEVHVWRADLETVSDGLCVTLGSDERARAERFLNEHDGRLWRRSRALLRALLGGYLQRDPSTLCFATGVHGKPALSEDEDRSRAAPARAQQLSFNLSHSGRTALYAFAAPGPIGVDVEVSRRPFDAVAIAERELGTEEAQRLRELPSPAREQEFLRAWVRHEAELKCQGLGLATADMRPDGPSPWIAELELGREGAAAVATPERPGELLCWQWPARPSAPPS